MAKRVAVFMAGGRGERFWPASTPECPKHLLKLFGGKSLMKLAVARVKGTVDEIRVVTSRPQEVAIRRTLKSLPAENILAEPQGRDTAAAVALATRWAQKSFGDEALVAMLPADAFIQNTRGFRETLREAFALAEATGALVTVGIPPTRPATGYGYLEKGEPLPEGRGFRVARFKEKPDEATAREYLASGRYLWNAGMFVWRVSAIAKALEEHASDIWTALRGIDPADSATLEAVYPTLRRISIDYAVMEKATNVVSVPARFDWDDVGEWPAWGRLQTADTEGNAIAGRAIAQQAKGNIVFSDQARHTVALLGVEGLVVVHTKNATLVMAKEKAQELKGLVEKWKDLC